MTTRSATLARMIVASTPLATRYFAGFNDDNRASQAPGLPNHFAWTLGHCALYMHHLAGILDGEPRPQTDFLADAEHAEGDPPTRFGTEGVAFNSTPSPDASRYPAAARCVEIFATACDRFAQAVRDTTEDQLEATMQWGSSEVPVADLIVRVNLHNAVHTGQLVDLRRALGLNRVIG